MNSISEESSSLKEELVSQMNDVIENKISLIFAKSDAKPAQNEALYSSLFPASDTAISPTSSAHQVAQPPQAPQTQPMSPEILVLSPKTDQSINSATLTSVKKFANKKLKNSKMVFLTCNDNNKKVSIGFPNADIRDKATALLNTGNELDSYGYQSKNANKMLPKVTIYGVSCEILEDIDTEGVGDDISKIRELEKHQIVMKIIEKNPGIKELYGHDHTLSVVYLDKVKRFRDQKEYFDLTIGLKLSPSIYRVLFDQQQGTLYIGSRRYSVTDRFYIKTCYHCQMIGHTSADCNDAKSHKLPVCMYCMGKHRSSICTNKQKKDVHVCARCLASPHGNDAECAKTHNAGSPYCPMLIRETNRLAANTDFTSKNVM